VSVNHAPPPEHAIEVASTLPASAVAAVHEVVSAAATADGVTPLHEPAMLQVTTEDQPHVTHLIARTDGRIVGYAQLDRRDAATPHLEVVVTPDARRRGFGGALVARARAAAAPRPLELWSHGDRPAAAALAARLGFLRVRELWLMRRDLDSELPSVPEVNSLRIRTFRPGEDETDWLRLNAKAFAEHPEQGQMTRADLDRRMAQSWFDPAGFFVAERDSELIGFHWTKVHAGDPPVGEVYVVGVDPDAQGLGLGRILTLVGLHHLRDHGLVSVVLYVEASNAAAIALYSRLGFKHTDTDVMYRG
jgi:mycothiol synthase